MKLSKRTKKIMIAAVSVIVLAFLCSLTAFADGEVAGAVESTWNAAKGQIKTIVNNVVFPVGENCNFVHGLSQTWTI